MDFQASIKRPAAGSLRLSNDDMQPVCVDPNGRRMALRPRPGIAVNATLYTREIEIDSNPDDGNTMIVTVNGIAETWVFKTAPEESKEVEIGESAAATAANLIAALGDSALVTAAEGGGTAQVALTSVGYGTAGAFALTGTAMTAHLVPGTPTAAVNATLGLEGDILFDATQLAICLYDNAASSPDSWLILSAT